MTVESPAAAHARGAAVIGPIHAPKASEIFADLLRQKILDGEFPEGQPLPSERSLGEQSRLSRAAVREAIGILKQQGLIVSKPGRNGGSIVTRPTSQELVASLQTYVRSQGWGADNRTLLEMREIIEPWCAAFAASHRTDEDLQRIRQRLDQASASIDRVEEYVSAGLSWHAAVADAGHNVLLSAFMSAASTPFLSAADHGRYDSLKARKSTLKTHKAITAAISDRDPQRAFDLMARHVQGSEAPLLENLATTLENDTAATG
ncbi:FCD domain-containing protein [Amycolatopsis acidiphila]|uniref:FadR family transcriptional regulator n=1 Tax=Amycolatopsis acidiphila TaxID=715473 RepID=A0A558A102_9PSEU|nr:FCD domain-containing protein [Amycolatopsis acidiphila]TVT17948.1 FadR family transcriptional regulator [Amycolatopsis acidiphila]UIJ57851.1 FCD domain-containing protein [Amycolatopsis acidiphila]GHG71410.1 GntR family transcriptional regulator [Amycolatopsis acidiphila]